MKRETFEVYITNLPGSVEKKEVEDIVKEFGAIADVHVVRGKGSALVRFYDQKEGALAIEKLHDTSHLNRRIYVRWSDHEEKLHQSQREEKHNTQNVISNFTESFDIYIGNVSDNASNTDLENLLKQFGKVQRVHVIKPSSRPSQTGFGNFLEKGDAERAISQLNGTEWMGQSISVRWTDTQIEKNRARRQEETSSQKDKLSMDEDKTLVKTIDDGKKRLIYVDNIEMEMTEAELRETFEKFGKLDECYLGKGPYGYVSYEKEEDGERAIATLNGTSLWGSVISVSWSDERRKTKTESRSKSKIDHPPQIQEDDIPALYVDPLPISVTVEEVEELFSPFGPLLHGGTHFGFKNHVKKEYCFVKFLNRESGEDAIKKLDRSTHFGRKIFVRWSDKGRKIRNRQKTPDRVTKQYPTSDSNVNAKRSRDEKVIVSHKWPDRTDPADDGTFDFRVRQRK